MEKESVEVKKIQFKVLNTVWRNDKNGWSVVNVEDKSGEKKTMVGNFHNLQENENLLVMGKWVTDSQYGMQFKANEYEILVPDTLEELKEYLGSGIIKGVRKRTAVNIVKYFGEDTKRILDEEPLRLAEVHGISERKAELIGQKIKENKEMRNLMIFLKQYGITPAYAVRIYNTYENKIYKILRENPYRLAEDINGIGFKKADEIALKGGLAKDSDFRIASGINYILEEAQGNGHMFLYEEELLAKSHDLLEVEKEHIQVVMEDKLAEKKIHRVVRNNHNAIYSNLCYYVELNIVKKFQEINIDCETPDKETVLQAEKKFGITLDVSQRDAILKVLTRGVGVITGGPGTGKTQTTKVLVEYFLKKRKKIALAAPTGRAAKRMSEVIGMQSQTIHRLLEVNGAEGGGSHFERNEENPLEEDVIIVDEASMIDSFLMNALLKAIKSPTRLILVGDVNQLPSVGPGNVLKDMILSECFPVGRLTKIFRQSEDSTIVTNAHDIINGVHVNISRNSSDFYFIRTQEKENVLKNIEVMVKERIPRKMGVRPVEIQVLSQIKSRTCGVENLNTELQAVLNPEAPDKQECSVANGLFREGDKVMQTKNNYQKEVYRNGKKYMGVFNGDTGFIEKIEPNEEYVTVVFDDSTRVVYTYKEMKDITLAYALTVHKSQGSEYPCVVIPIQDFIPQLSSRNLLYTAVTRAKKMVVLIGREDIFHMICQNNQDNVRNTGLKELLLAKKEL